MQFKSISLWQTLKKLIEPSIRNTDTCNDAIELFWKEQKLDNKNYDKRK